ncbi:hypothetical protein C346_06916 [Cryptococcus neoformans D17-1]|nr:hypothetical protein C346_06916 [Cryptococcus neoformans var. grubii D17-1]
MPPPTFPMPPPTFPMPPPTFPMPPDLGWINYSDLQSTSLDSIIIESIVVKQGTVLMALHKASKATCSCLSYAFSAAVLGGRQACKTEA